MKVTNEFNEWDRDLKALLGSPPTPDFDEWQNRFNHRIATEEPASQDESAASFLAQPIKSKSHRALYSKMLQIAAMILVVCSVTWLFVSISHEKPLIAGEIQGIDKVTLLSWTELIYVRVTSEDRQRTWIETQKAEIQYQHPGKYRKTYRDPTGGVNFIQIIDATIGRELTLNPKDRTAELKYFTEKVDDRGPFAWVGDYVRGTHPGSVSLAGQTVMDGVESYVIKWKGGRSDGRSTFYISSETQKLTGITSVNPGVDFDSEKFDEDVLSLNEERWHYQEPIASKSFEFKYLDGCDLSAFSLDAPEGYRIENIAKPTVTEDEIIAFLRAAVEFNGGIFPDSAVNAYDVDKFNASSKLTELESLKEFQSLREIRDRIMRRGIYRAPILQFIEDHTEPETFQYVGGDVHLADADQIVAWYRPKNSWRYRVWFGDLTVKEMAAEELPIVKELIHR